MDQPAVLSFSAPHGEPKGLEVLASPALELAYAFFLLAQQPEPEQRRAEFGWVDDVYRQAPELPGAVAAFWGETAKRAGIDLFWMIAELGYARDRDPKRFLDELPELPAVLLERLEAREGDAEDAELAALLAARLQDLREPQRAAAYQALLVQLWAQLEPRWLAQGAAAVEAAKAELLARFGTGGDVMAALPAHHYTQFEASAEKLRAAQAAGTLRVVPLSVAASGGFSFDVANGHFLGFGLRSERVFSDLKARAERTGGQLKALADPTRLLLLILIARYEQLPITVSDLARQLGVSQPTVSGHLKLLRQAGLVRAEKSGTRTLYRPQKEALRALLTEAGALLTLG